MSRSMVFKLKCKDKLDDLLLTFKLIKEFENDDKVIYENNDMRVSYDKGCVVRVLVFNGNNETLVEKLREYFYGEEYKNIQ